jgi:hypothetical protein
MVMDVGKIPERLRFWVIALVLTIVMLILAIVIVTYLGWITLEDYSTKGAPFLEEAFKGFFAFLIAAALYQSQKFKVSLRIVGIFSGILTGLMFGRVEGVLQIIMHPVWTTAVSLGFCSFLLTSKRFLPFVVYLIAVGAHASWNFNVYNTSTLALPISIVLSLLAILIAFLTFPRTRQRSWSGRHSLVSRSRTRGMSVRYPRPRAKVGC